MQGNSRFRAICIPFILTILVFFSACQATPPPVADGALSQAISPPEQSFGPFIPVGEKVERNLGTTVEEVRNCIPDNEPIVKTPSRSIVKSLAAEWSVGGRTGVGLTIGEGVLPGGANLGASIEMTYGQRSAESEEVGDGWQLPAKPGKIVTYILEWTEIWQPGYIELRIADQEVKKIDVLVRTDISSRIQGESVQLCEDFEQATPLVNEVTPTVINPVTPLQPSSNRVFTVEDAERTVLGPLPNCDYSLPNEFTLNYGETGAGGKEKTWDLTRLPSGIIVGDAYLATVDSTFLGQQVLFMIPTSAGQTLTLTDGAFLIVSPQNAEGVFRLRERNLDCRGLNIAIKRW